MQELLVERGLETHEVRVRVRVRAQTHEVRVRVTVRARDARGIVLLVFTSRSRDPSPNLNPIHNQVVLVLTSRIALAL